MAKKKLIFLTACSMVASGFALASNVSLADRIGRFVSDAFQFEGPVSGLVAALVRSQDQTGDRPVISFQVAQRNSETSGAAAASSSGFSGAIQAIRSAVAEVTGGGGAAVHRQAHKGNDDRGTGAPLVATSGQQEPAKTIQISRLLKGAGNGDVTAGLVGDRPSLDGVPLKTIASTVGTIEIPPIATTQAGNSPLLLAAVTNGEVAAGIAMADADEPGTVAQAITIQAVQPTTAIAKQGADVPLPSGVALLGLGILGLAVQRRKA